MNLRFYDKKPFIYSLFLLSVGLIIFISVVAWQSARSLAENGERLSAANQIIADSERIISLLKDAETGQRGYLLTHKLEFLYPFWKARASIYHAYDSLRVLTQHNGSQQKQLEEIKHLIERKITDLEESMVIRDRYGLDSCVRQLGEGGGRRIMDSLRLEISYLQYTERQILKKESVDFTYMKTYMAQVQMVAGGMTLLLLSMSFSLLIRKLMREEREKDMLEMRVEERTAELAASNQQLTSSSQKLASSNEKLRTSNEKLNEASLELKKLLTQKEVLLREVYHRVKNNIGVVSGLLELQMVNSDNEEVREKLKAAQDRIRTVSLIQEKLHKSENLASINLRLYLYDLIHNLRESYGVGINEMELEIDVAEVFLQVTTLNPLGLIVNELITNCFKYAFRGIKYRRIEVIFQKTDENYFLIVRDNGRGLPEGFNPETTNSLGLQLVVMLSEQIDGKVEIKSRMPHPGAEIIICFNDFENYITQDTSHKDREEVITN